MRVARFIFCTVVLLVNCMRPASSQDFTMTPKQPSFPWSDQKLDPDVRADLVIKEMTLDEKISLLHGQGVKTPADEVTESNGGGGFLPALRRLGLPSIQMADSSSGVTKGDVMGRYSTALPSNLAAVSSWDVDTAIQFGNLIGQELRDQGYNMALGGGGMNLVREPRDGRNFEYLGEDPMLAGIFGANVVKAEQSKNVIGTLKHFAMNDQETGREAFDARIDERSMYESDLLAFELALKNVDAGAVMCAYNRVNGTYACESDYLLQTVLRKDLGFKGFVVSDWNATHSTVKASRAGLDVEQPFQFGFGEELKKAFERGEISESELDQHVHRLLRTVFALGLFDTPSSRRVPDVAAGLATAQQIAEKSIVLLKNEASLLPLNSSKIHSIIVIGGHADKGVPSGGGSSQVDPPGGNPVPPSPSTDPMSHFFVPKWMPSSPFIALQRRLPTTQINFLDGSDINSAVGAAKSADVVIIFVYQLAHEASDLSSLSLPFNQDDLIRSVANVNKKTVVVLETSGAVTAPWIDHVSAVLEAWYPGIRGGEAIANILTGEVNPSAKLPITFPASEADLPRPHIEIPPKSSNIDLTKIKSGGDFYYQIAGQRFQGFPPFPVRYDEGLKVGYKWFDAENKPVLFPFGFGLSYSKFDYSGLAVSRGPKHDVRFTVKNVSSRPGTEIAQVYASLPTSTDEPPKRLVAWARVQLAPGEAKTISLAIDDTMLSIFDVQVHKWLLVPGEYKIFVGGSSRQLPLEEGLDIPFLSK